MEPKDPPEQADSLPVQADEWGLPAPTTRMDEPADAELGYCAGEDDEDRWD